MRILLGLKDYEAAHHLIQVIEHLRPPQLELDALRVIESPGGAIGKFLLVASEGDFYGEYLKAENLKVQALFEAIRSECERRQIAVKLYQSEGDAAQKILSCAQEQKADLIAIHLAKRGLGESLLTTRVSRQLLAHAPCSLLFKKDDPDPNQLKRFVFATDHSEYAQKALDKLIAFGFQGVEEIIVMTAFPGEVGLAIRPLLGQLPIDFHAWARGKFIEEQEKALTKLRQAGYKAQAEIREEPVHKAIANSMREHKADLLVLGSQGHDFLDRLKVGSVSFHETIYGPHSTLIIRHD